MPRSRHHTRPSELRLAALWLGLGLGRVASAATLHVDPQISVASCTTYDSLARTCGAGTAFAWRSLVDVRAAAATAPGDIVLLRGGTYADALVPGASGTSGSPITYQAYPGETPVITGGSLDPAVDLTGRSHLVLEGLTVTDVVAWLRGDGSDYNVIRANTFRRATASGSRAGVKLVRSRYNRVLDNVIDDGNDNFQLIHSDYNLFAGNRLTRARHNLWDILCGNRNVIRGNDFENVLQKMGQVTDCEGVPSDATPAFDATRRNLIEANRFRFTPSSGNASPYAGIQYAAQQGIIRRNMFHDTTGPALDLTLYSDEARFNTDNRIYHNVFHATSFAGVSLAPVVSGSTFRGNVFVNNILSASVFVANDTRWPWYTDVLNGQSVQLLTGRLDGLLFLRNNILGDAPGGPWAITYGQRTSSTNPPPRTLAVWQTTYPLLFAENLETDPLFVDAAARDFRLGATSPMIDAGAFLTTTTAAGSGTVLPVADASWFYDGYTIPGEVGDLIQLESGTETARILAVDDAALTLTLDRSLVWSSGQGVSLAYAGTAPDIGAIERVPCSPLPAAVAGVLGTKRGNDVVLAWDPAVAPTTTTAYNVWKVIDGDRTRIPLANGANLGPAIEAPPGCTGGAGTTCTDQGAVSAPPGLVYYQVRGACGDGTEGTAHGV